MRVLARISYDGSYFYGFQRLPNLPSVQGCLEKCLSKILGVDVHVWGAGRTDAGVHALMQCVHFDVGDGLDIQRLKYRLNSMLPLYLRVNSLEIVSSSFHARYSVKEKKYVYLIYLGKDNAFLSRYVYNCPYSLSIDKIKSACNIFMGKHNFKNFVSGQRINYDSVINKIEVRFEKNFLILSFYGQGFYRYMVRSLVGALILIGRGKVSESVVKSSLVNPDCDKRFFIAPSCGLYLAKICY